MLTATRLGWCRAKGTSSASSIRFLSRCCDCLKGQRAILDGEVVLDGAGHSNFRDLMSSHTKMKAPSIG